MLFNSLEYIFIFVPIVFIGYYLLGYFRRYRISQLWLIAGSLLFYGWWNITFLPLILFSVFFNYHIGQLLLSKNKRSRRKRKIFATIGVSANLLLLGYFKYFAFFVSVTAQFTGTHHPSFTIVLPLAISFFTFQQIAFIVDCYKNKVKKNDFVNYALFVTFFPQLIAGPIVHHSYMIPQFQDNDCKKLNYDNIAMGLIVFSIGLFKKIGIADQLSHLANAGFDNAAYLTFWESWTSVLSYTFQIYFDFSGYTDMAIGVALMLNIKLPFNFNSPYKATSIQDFWRRWHITLSNFLRDYLYIPLGGNRKGKVSTLANLMITFLLGGLWHGAGFTFIIWGGLHGAALIIHRLWQSVKITLWPPIAWLLTFLFVCLTWVFFRAETISDASSILKSMTNTRDDNMLISLEAIDQLSSWTNIPIYKYMPYSLEESTVNILALPFILIVMIFILSMKNTNQLRETNVTPIKLIYAGLLFSLAIVISLSSSTEVFLYFNF